MSHKRLTTWQKATALVPLALLSGAWTTTLAASSTATASTTTLPDGTTVPDAALEAPASMSRPGSIAPGVPAGAIRTVVAGSSTDGIPDAALAAYQRAEQVINSADESCNLTWQLVAAIGRVESDHGRYGGNTLGDDGRSRPGIFGIPLDGSDNTQEIRDSDAGQYDDDRVFDRAVGPMQFIPQTWSVVGVDGDGDGRRDPQDIDDAALATAVYLCSGEEDLSTYGGQKAAVYRYNHSREYVDLVISIMNAYLDGDYSSVPNGVSSPLLVTPAAGGPAGSPVAGGKGQPGRRGGGRDGETAPGSGDGAGVGGGSGGGSVGGSVGGGGGGSAPGTGGSPETPVDSAPPAADKPGDRTRKAVTEVVEDATEAVEDVTEPVTKPLDEATGGTLTKAEAKAKCLTQGISALDVAALNACIADLTS